MTCSSCKYLNEEKKMDGKVSGSLYFCSKLGTYVDGCEEKCKNHEKAYCRTNFKCDEIYNEGKNFYDDDRKPSYYMMQLVIVIIFGLILKLLIL